MSSPTLNAVHAVLSHYPLDPQTVAVEAQGNRGGFSGARLWRCRQGPRQFCLRAWPPDGPSLQHLGWAHALMRAANRDRLPFVPELLGTRSGEMWVDLGGRVWELTGWMPGTADFHASPTPARLRVACSALARLHRCWERYLTGRAPCPAIDRRLYAVLEWQLLLRRGWRPRFEGRPDLDAWAGRAWRLVSVWMERVPALLGPWGAGLVPTQPCLCDVWHDHLLFEGDRLTGLVDYGGVKQDHVAVDLARMLGSLVGDDRESWALGLAAYRSERPLSGEDEELALVLDRTGVVVGASNWLRWLYHDGRRFDDLAGVVRRLAALVERMERWTTL